MKTMWPSEQRMLSYLTVLGPLTSLSNCNFYLLVLLPVLTGFLHSLQGWGLLLKETRHGP